jgi:hypothetical protein
VKAEPVRGDVTVPSGTWSFEEATLQKPRCLRCDTELRDYRMLRFNFMPYGMSRQNAMLVCASCGHIEVVTKDSALLKNLNAMASAGGDDD